MEADGAGLISIGCAVDDSFAMPLAAMVQSALGHLEAPWKIDLHVVDAGLLPATKDRLERSLVSPALSVNWISFDRELLRSVPVWGRMNAVTYCRLLMSELLPDSLRKVLWLDCDLIVLRDLSELWRMDPGDNVLFAAQDLVVPFVSSPCGVSAYRELGLAADAKHFNAGVMLVGLDRWREQRVEEQARGYLERNHDKVWFWDQEALNACLSGMWSELDPRWNQIASVAGRSFFTPAHLSPDQYEELVERPWIVHFAGALKPWLTGRSPHAGLLKEYLSRTEWRGWRRPRTPRNLLLGFYDSALRGVLYRFEYPALMAQRSVRPALSRLGQVIPGSRPV